MDEQPLVKTSSSGPVPVVRIGSATATLINGVLGDPLLRLELVHRRRSLLFDLGDPGRMSARVAHQVTDVFISHTHADHIGGFLWFLRSRVGPFPACRFYGPRGLARQVAGMVGGILWDRVEDRGPCFEIREWHGDHLRCYWIEAGEGDPRRLDDLPLVDSIIWSEPAFVVRAAELDHDTPVLAYAWESTRQLKVRRDQLEAMGLKNGQWLQVLKEAVLGDRMEEVIATPDGREWRVDELSEHLLLVAPGQKLVYATDFADTAANRDSLISLATGAHSLFCEASFMVEHADQAVRTRHLTTRACADIANSAGVGQLFPFHFSRRYTRSLPDVYRELSGFCSRTVLPGFIADSGEGDQGDASP